MDIKELLNLEEVVTTQLQRLKEAIIKEEEGKCFWEIFTVSKDEWCLIATVYDDIIF